MEPKDDSHEEHPSKPSDAVKVSDSGTGSPEVETLQSVLSHKLEEQTGLLRKLSEPKTKDGWEKFASISPLISTITLAVIGTASTIILAVVGTGATLLYNYRESERNQQTKKREVLISEAQAVKDLIPQLSGPNKAARRTALLTLCSLNNVDLATRLAPQYATDGGVEALEDLNKRILDASDKQRVREALALAYKQRGDNFYEASDYFMAIQDYTKAVSLDPSLIDGYNARFYAYLASKRFTEAERDIESQYQINHDDYVKYYLYGRLETDRENYDKAIAAFDAAMKLEFWPELIYRRAVALHLKGELRRALDEYSRAISMQSYPPALIYQDRARCREELGDIKGAQEDRKMAEKIDQENKDAELRQAGANNQTPVKALAQ
jgi:tetratricopeptide (TPR) repeat protein